jgi:hypothetical protein
MNAWRGRLAHGLWLANTLVLLLIFAFGASARYKRLQVPCAVEPRCVDEERLPPSGLRRLAEDGLSLSVYAGYLTALASLPTLCALVINAIMLWRRAVQRTSRVLAILLAWMSLQVISMDTIYPGPGWLVQVITAAQTLSVILFLLVFPDGRFVPRWSFLMPVLITGLVLAESVLSAAGLRTMSDLLIGAMVWIAFLLVAIGGQIYRYVRVSGPVQRQQSKAFLFALAAWVSLTLPIVLAAPPPGSWLALLGRTTNYLGVTAIVLAIAYAVLRYRLWDVDVLIRRTLVYTALTVLLALTYFGIVLTLESIVQPLTGRSQSALVTVISTLIIAALFGPLRARVQAAIDRRFFRRRYSAARTLAAFGQQARDETDLQRLSEHLLRAVDDTMQPAHVSLWLKRGH